MTDNKNTEEFDKQIQDAYVKAEEISLISVLKLVYLTTKIDLYKDFKLDFPLSSSKSNKIKTGEVIITDKDSNKYKIYLDIVDKDYDLFSTLSSSGLISSAIKSFNEIDEKNKKELIGIISFLSQSCLLVFNNIKGVYKELLEYMITLDDNTTMYLDFNLDKRIGIIFEKIIES